MGRHFRILLSGVIAFLLTLTVALLYLVGTAFPAAAQNGAVVWIDPASAEVDVGDTVTVTVRITDVTDLSTAAVYLSFDPDFLQVVDADPDEDDVQIEPGDFLSPGTVDENDVYENNEEIAFAQVADGPVSGGGVLATIVFLGKAAGESDIDFYENSALEDEDNIAISASFQGGSITVTGEGTLTPTVTLTPEATSEHTPTPTPTPEPAADDTPMPTPTSEPDLAPSPTVPPPTATTSGIEARVLQVWPDRSIGVASELLEGSAAHADTQKLPFGVFASAGETVRARTYLHFPLGVFPPGTQVLKATLYVYVDSSSDTGEAEFGVYRTLDPWGEVGWEGDPATWPALLSSPIAVTTARFDATASGLPAPANSAGALELPPPVGGASKPLLAFVSPISPLPTPTLEPTATPTGAPVPTSSPGSTAPVMTLGEVEGAWLEWDVTALMRAWLAGEVPDYGLALAPAPDPNADPETAGNLFLARLLTADDPTTKPYIIADIEIHPVTPTPTPAPILPSAGGSSSGWGAAGFLLVGVALLALGLAVQRRD